MIIRRCAQVEHLASKYGMNHDAQRCMTHAQFHNERLMTERLTPTAEHSAINPPIDRGMSISKAAIITVVSVVLMAASSVAVVKGTLSAGMTRLSAVVALLALVAMVYGLIELALAVIATTTERRRMAREVSERRKGDRARKPTPH
jgi:hypothetical protein